MFHLAQEINPTQQYISEWVEVGDGIVVHRYSIIGTSVVAYEVYEPLAGHSTMTTHEDRWLGSLTTRPLPTEIEALPGWTPGFRPGERIRAASKYYAELEQQAKQIIRQAFPQDF